MESDTTKGYWCGRPIEELDKEQLLDALVKSWDYHEKERNCQLRERAFFQDLDELKLEQERKENKELRLQNQVFKLIIASCIGALVFLGTF